MSNNIVIVENEQTNIVKVLDPVNKIIKTDDVVRIVNQQYGVVIDQNNLVLPIVQESEPVGTVEGELWFQPVTMVMSVYTDGVWVQEASDDGFF